MSNRKSLKFPTSAVIYIVVSFLLGLLDMTLLYRVVGRLMHLDNAMSMLIALLLATVANFTALTWGKANGENMATKNINKHSVGSFVAWVLIGLIYTAIRISGLIFNKGGFNEYGIVWDWWIGQILQISILAVSYIGTGVLISSSARAIWDKDAQNMRQLTKEFNQAHDDISKAAADLEETILTLSKFHLNFPSLDRQYKKIESAIYRAENATMSDIVGKVISENPEVTPSEFHRVKDEILDRRKKNEK